MTPDPDSSAGKAMPTRFIESRRGGFMLLLLTFAAACVDAISFLGVGDVFTANMTGNTVLLGLAVGQGHGWKALKSILALVGFILGVAGGTMLVDRYPQRGRWSAWITRSILAEAVFLAIFAFTWLWAGRNPGISVKYLLIVVSAIAMGMQSATVRYLNVPGVVTTYITGTITSIIAEITGGPAILHAASHPHSEKAPAIPHRELPRTWMERLRLQAGVPVVYCLGAMASIAIGGHWPAYESLLPLAALLAVVILAPRI